MKENLTPEERRELQLNFWGALAMSVFAVAYLAASVAIPNISTAQWYDSPSLFPIVIGMMLLICSVIYLWQNRQGWKISPDDIEQIKKYFRSSTFLRLVIAAGTLAVYVFVLLGLRIGSFRLPYEAATFIYLFVTMAYFRPKGFAIWKIALISVVLSVVIGYGFSNFAKIPLP